MYTRKTPVNSQVREHINFIDTQGGPSSAQLNKSEDRGVTKVRLKGTDKSTN